MITAGPQGCAQLSTVRVGRASQAVLAQLTTLIESGEWPVGSKIPPEPALVTALGVGRNTIREAVRALEHAGLLEPRRGDGTYVRATNDLAAVLLRRVRRASNADTIAVCRSLEHSAVTTAATGRTGTDISAIDAAVANCREASQSKNHEAFIDADLELHHAIVAASGNAVLVELYLGLLEALRQVGADRSSIAHGAEDLPRHERIASAIVAGDPDAARSALAQAIS